MGIRSLKSASISTGTKRSKFWDQTSTLPADFEVISTVTVTGSATSGINFTSIPQTYSSLWMIGNVISSSAAPNFNWTYNNVTTSTYNYLYMENATNGANATTTYALGGTAGPDGASIVVKIPDYAATNKYKSSIIQTATPAYISSIGQQWQSTAAISSIQTFLAGNTFAVGSTVTLYGLR